MEKKKREINMELLRILAMFLVVTLHCIQETSILTNLQISNFNFLGIELIKAISLICNTLFILITGYYMINAKFRLKKILSLWGITIFYSTIICLIMAFTTDVEIKWEEGLMPIITDAYWFISAYIVVYFLSPILNLTIKKMTKDQFKYLLIVMTVIYGGIAVFFGIYFNNVPWMIYNYLIGAYIRKYLKIEKEKGQYLLKFFVSILFVVFVKLLIIIFSPYIKIPIMQATAEKVFKIFEGFTNPIIIYAATCLFIKSRTIEIKNEKIEKIATLIVPSIFSIYIIHYNINIRKYLWTEMFYFNSYASSGWLMVYMISAIIYVFISCIIIDLTRRGIYYLLKKIPIVKKTIDKLNSKIELVDKIVENIFSDEKEKDNIEMPQL